MKSVLCHGIQCFLHASRKLWLSARRVNQLQGFPEEGNGLLEHLVSRKIICGAPRAGSSRHFTHSDL